MAIPTLPFEILESVVSEVDLPVDLLQLALACSGFASIIIPRHLYYRVIQHSVESGSCIWEALAKDKDLARNVRTLELDLPDIYNAPPRSAIQLAQRRSMYPPLLPQDVTKNNLPDRATNIEMHPSIRSPEQTVNDREESFESVLRGALRNMKGLVRFQWGPRWPANALVDNSTDADDGWHILCTIPTLRHLKINDAQSEHYRTPIHRSAVSNIHNWVSSPIQALTQ